MANQRLALIHTSATLVPVFDGLCKRIGVIATLSTTLDPTADLIERCAANNGKDVQLTSRLCDGAFDALMRGESDRHDEMLVEALRELSGQVDVIALAQASMARVVDTLAEADRPVPILASPPLAIDYLARTFVSCAFSAKIIASRLAAVILKGRSYVSPE